MGFWPSVSQRITLHTKKLALLEFYDLNKLTVLSLSTSNYGNCKRHFSNFGGIRRTSLEWVKLNFVLIKFDFSDGNKKVNKRQSFSSPRQIDRSVVDKKHLNQRKFLEPNANCSVGTNRGRNVWTQSVRNDKRNFSSNQM